MRIALLICGTTRNYKENYVTWKNHLLNLYNVDIFFHTYNINGYHLQNSYLLTNNDIDLLLKTIQPKKYLIEDYNIKTDDFKNSIVSQCIRRGSAKPESIKSQLYSIYMSNLLKTIYEKENNFKYDIVIKIRFDTVFYQDFNINDCNTIIQHKNVILCGNPNIKTMLYKNACINCIENFNKDIFIKCSKHTCISDIVIISSSTNMDHYANIYFDYDRYIKENHDKIVEMYGQQLNNYISHKYSCGAIIYISVPKITCIYPESALSHHLEDYILLNYSFRVDTNRNIL